MLELITQALPFWFKVVFFAALIYVILDIGKYLDKQRNIRILTTRLRYDGSTLIDLVRKFYPKMIAQELVGVQPMTVPTGDLFSFQATFGSPKQLDLFPNELIAAQRDKWNKEYYSNPVQLKLPFPPDPGLVALGYND